ncbi:helix-turn-helix domain-containing protein [Paenibacillus koleovorans]|uniref:helix-turn-helix domain-containing protein n=1 Tax=Paenibacillus koleovorans TaxID=121608 RepID=UPI0013E29C3A|nr:AraC family transcriptional regulator [Paenibacillus koleovorans]
MWKYIDHVQVSTAIRGHQGQWDMPYHSHVSIEISTVLDGGGGFAWGADEEAHVLEPGDVVLIPSSILHRFWTKGAIRFAVLHAGHFNKEMTELFHTIVPEDKPRILHLSAMDLDMYESMFRNWLRAVSQPLREREKVVNTWIRLFLLTLLQQSDAKTKPLSVMNAAEYIRTNMKQALPIQELARLSGLSESSFRRLFHETYGVSPKQYLQQARLTEAKFLLRSSTKSIQLISEQIGFLSIHAFSSWFQKMEGTSPNEWRKQQQGDQLPL